MRSVGILSWFCFSGEFLFLALLKCLQKGLFSIFSRVLEGKSKLCILTPSRLKFRFFSWLVFPEGPGSFMSVAMLIKYFLAEKSSFSLREDSRFHSLKICFKG